MKRLAAISLFVIAGGWGVARAEAPANAVLCQDGTTAVTGAGACGEHGGVAAEGSAMTRAKAGQPLFEATERKRAGAGTEPRVYCKDGMVTNAGEGACLHNGGIARATPAAHQATRSEPTSVYPKSELLTPGPAPASTGSQPTARCRDGSLSYAGYSEDACVGYGGVSEWLVPAPR